MISNPSHAARTLRPLTVAICVFAATQIVSIPIGHGALVAVAVGGGCVAYNRLPESFREKVDSKYARVKQLLRERFAHASSKVQHTARSAAVQIQRIVANGVLIILIWAAFTGEALRQFVETIKLSAQVCGGESVLTTEQPA
jgi:hypothetical protein